jgi:uncharacterized protein
MRPSLRANHYGEAMLAAAQVIGSRIAQAKGVRLQSSPHHGRRQRPEPVPWTLVGGGLFALLWVLGVAGRRGGGMGTVLPAMLLGNLLGRSYSGGRGYSSRSHGGFGGYDSGDSFGGFGGGDSGGGGASSDW